MFHKLHHLLFTSLFLSFTVTLSAQDLDPRAYTRVPVDMTFLVAGFSYTYGPYALNPTLAIEDLDAKAESPMFGVGHTFNLFSLTSQAFVSLPYCWAQASGNVTGETKSITRSGLSDMQIRISVLLFGAPAATLKEFANYSSDFILGTSLTVVAPTGQFLSDKLVNIGTNRWSFKPEIGMSLTMFKQWDFDLYAGIWLFTDNDSYFPGNSVRSQDPLITLQTHVSYNFNPLMWAAIDFTYYTGGQSSVNGVYNDDRQNNTRIGATFNLPVSKQNSIKMSYSTGAVIRFGGNFSTISIAWQTAFF